MEIAVKTDMDQCQEHSDQTDGEAHLVCVAGYIVPRAIATMLQTLQQENEKLLHCKQIAEQQDREIQQLKQDKTKLIAENKRLRRQNKALTRQLYGTCAEGLKTKQLPLFDKTDLTEKSKPGLNDHGKKTLDATCARIRELNRELRQQRVTKRSHTVREDSDEKRASCVLVESQYETVWEVPLEPENKTCQKCHAEKDKLGEDHSYTYDWIPGRLVKRVKPRPKYICPNCRDFRDVSQEAPQSPILRSSAGPSLLAKIITDKFAYGLPFDRQSRIFRSIGVNLSVTRLCTYVKNLGWLFLGLATKIKDEVLASELPQFDASGIKIRDLQQQNNLKKSTVWFYCGDRGSVFCEIEDSTSGEYPQRFLENYSGYFQCDGANSFNRIETEERWRLGCWAHLRRKFEQDSREGDQQSLFALVLIKEIYKLHELMTLGQTERKEELDERVNNFFKYAKELKLKLSQNDLGYNGATYAKNQEKALRRNFERTHFKLDNNRVEQQVKTLGQGRRNYFFIGSPEMAKPTAAIYSVIFSALELKLNVYEYLEDILSNCHKLLAREQKSWTPREWSKRRNQTQLASDCSPNSTLSTKMQVSS